MSSPAADASALSQACTALWLATLSLMTAFMRTPAPAHRYLLARRIARNLRTLHEQECFTRRTRASFDKLAKRWQRQAEMQPL
jgi:aminoglycoside phosphotransferase